MEKINFKGEIDTATLSSACANKINEIIDELHTINVQKVTIDRLVEEDRLKTLEDKIEFIMGNTKGLKEETITTLQDIWDEQNDPQFIFKKDKVFCNGELIREYKKSEPTVKEDKKWLDMGDSYDDVRKDQKIEEIISGLHKEFDDYHLDIQEFESWLRDKLKSL